MIAPPARTKYSAFFAWWSAVANGYGTRIAGFPAAASSQTELPGARDHEVGGGVGGADPLGRRDQAVVGPPDPRLERPVVALAGDVEDRRARRSANASMIVSLIERAPASAPATSSTGPSDGSSKISRASLCGIVRARRRDRPADDAEARLVPALERIGEEDPLREPERHPVREPEVRVGLGERRRDAHRRGREDHRPGDVARRRRRRRRGAGGRRIARHARGATPAR